MVCLLFAESVVASKPNVVLILCDDLGYGDVHCLNPLHGKIPTPAIDRFATQGMIFTDAHAGASVCTPTRYGLLTGRYSWRTSFQKGVVSGFAPCLIPSSRPTVASFLKSQGYQTAIVGKWHLNFQYTHAATAEPIQERKGALPPIGSVIPDGPIHRGFDSFRGFHHARDMKAVIENDRVVAHDPEIHMLPRLTREAVRFITQQADDNRRDPFFLYVPLGSPHTPILPTKQWEGKSGLGSYGDFVMQTDAAIGEIIEALDQHPSNQNSLVIVSSDNGCSKAADIAALAEQGHKVSAHYRGSKADLWEGGHRIPFIVRWPGVVTPGSSNSQTICLTDLFATLANAIDVPIPPDAAEDSVSFLPALRGQKIESTRAGIVHHSISGHFGYRQGNWKLLLARGSGGWSSPTELESSTQNPEAQLYDLDNDPSETTNLFTARPEIAQRLLTQLMSDVERGRSTQGPDSKNDTDQIVLWKSKSPSTASVSPK
jgi:arylsulfatase A-like enzyme